MHGEVTPRMMSGVVRRCRTAAVAIDFARNFVKRKVEVLEILVAWWIKE